jgi:hypothetical protein
VGKNDQQERSAEMRVLDSVADPGYLLFIPDPDFCFGSRNQEQHQKRRGKKIFVVLFFVATNITELKNILF